jgi:cation transport protein ChaC
MTRLAPFDMQRLESERLTGEALERSLEQMLAEHAQGNDIWVFGYGSLMWNPGFNFFTREPGLVHGWHRAFCVYSQVWRGTPERPGLVLGLDRGGSCRGIAFAIDPKDEADVIAYLDERERVTNVYARKRLTVALTSGETVGAWSYVADRTHPQYAGKLALEHAATLIAHGIGRGGPNPEYLENTIQHLDRLGIPEGPLHALRAKVRALASSRGAP